MSSGRPPKRPRSPFGQRLLAARQASGLSQAQVARQLGITQHGYARWEREPVALRPEQLLQLALVLDTNVGELVGERPAGREKEALPRRSRRLFAAMAKLPHAKQAKVLKILALVLEE